MKKITSILAILSMTVGIASTSGPVFASEAVGNMTTGASSAQTANNISGNVVGPVPSATPAPQTTNNGGGGGGGGYGGGSNYSQIQGDTNYDGRVDIIDFVALMANWGNTTFRNIADFNADARVDISDFVIIMANWTK